MAETAQPHSSSIRWLDAPNPPEDSVLDRLSEVFEQQTTIREAWLLRLHVTPSNEEPREETAIAVAIDHAADPASRAGAELIAALTVSLRAVIDVGSWIFVNDGIREKTDRQGLKVFPPRTPG